MNRVVSALLVLALASAGAGRAHEIPNEVVAHLLARADGQRFQIVVRVPLSSMRDIEVPEFGPGYLDIEALAPHLEELATQWLSPFVEVYADGSRLPMPRTVATQISLPSKDSLVSFDRALAHIAGPLPSSRENLHWSQVFLDALLEYPLRKEASDFAIRPNLGHLAARVVTALRYELADGTARAYHFAQDPGLVPLDPRWWQAAWRFVALGFQHILDGPDHLLFLFCLVVPLRRIRPLVLIVSAFTIAHSATLMAAALGLAPEALWFPPLIETFIAVSILYMALENIVGATKRRWLFALGFGLVHGFGFSFALHETLQFAGAHLVTSLLAFNVGVELGQLCVLLLLVPALAGLFRFVVAERVGTIIASALAAHAAWHWTAERAEVLGRFDFLRGALPAWPWWAGGALGVGAGLAAHAYVRRRSRRSGAADQPRLASDA